MHFISRAVARLLPEVTFSFSCLPAGAEDSAWLGSSPTFGIVSLFNHGRYCGMEGYFSEFIVAWGSNMAFPGSLGSLSSVTVSIFLGSVCVSCSEI